MPDDKPDQPMDLKTVVILIAIFSALVIYKLVADKFIWRDSWKSEMVFGIIGFGWMTVVIFFYYFKSRKK